MQQYLLFIVRVSYFQVDINVLTPIYSIGSSYTLHNDKLTLERNKVLDIQINECTLKWCRVTLTTPRIAPPRYPSKYHSNSHHYTNYIL